MAVLLAGFRGDAVELGGVRHDSGDLSPIVGVFHRERGVADLRGCRESGVLAVFQSKVLTCLSQYSNTSNNAVNMTKEFVNSKAETQSIPN